MTRKNKIANGPSKFDLCFTFFALDNRRRRQPVTFTAIGPSFNPGEHEFEIVINKLEWEDGSGESWLFTGYARIHVDNKVTGYFDTRTRKGWFEITIL